MLRAQVKHIRLQRTGTSNLSEARRIIIINITKWGLVN